jgi:hypothetical protein
MQPWGDPYRACLRSLEFSQKNTQTTLQKHIIAIEESEQSIRRLEQAIHETAEDSPHAPMIKALDGLGGCCCYDSRRGWGFHAISECRELYVIRGRNTS